MKSWVSLAEKVPLAVVTNCSEALGQIAAVRTGIAFDAVVTAERAGFYKPHPRPYRLALEALGAAPEATLFVAGSAYDLVGAAAIGMKVFLARPHRRGAAAGGAAPDRAQRPAFPAPRPRARAPIVRRP